MCWWYVVVVVYFVVVLCFYDGFDSVGVVLYWDDGVFFGVDVVFVKWLVVVCGVYGGCYFVVGYYVFDYVVGS